MEDELEQSDQTTRAEKTPSDAPLEQSETQDPQTTPQEQDVTSDSKEINDDDTKDKPSKEEIGDNSSSSTAESKVPMEAQELNSNSVSSSQPMRGRQYQLAFDVDDTGSEASLTSSPKSLDMTNPVMSYLSQHHYLPSPMASQSHDLESLSHDLVSESRDHKEETIESTDDGGDTKPKASTTSVEDDISSVYSSSTLRPSSVAEKSVATKPPPSDTSEKEREESVKTPDSVVKMEDITLITDSPDGSHRETPPPQPKVHALNILTSDSDAGESPPYSPVPYLSGESAITKCLCVILKAICVHTCICLW